MTLPTKVVYLSGPIAGLSYDDATKGWRAEAAQFFEWYFPHIQPLSPMRGKTFLKGLMELDSTPGKYESNPMSTSKGITYRDVNDVRMCDAMLVNFLGTERISIGTCIEFGVAWEAKKPIVMVIEPGNLHNHAMINTMAAYVTSSLEEGLYLTANLLTPGT